MNRTLNPPLTAKDGRILRVLIICRVSSPGPGKQDERSLDDQEALIRAWLDAHTDLPYEITVISGSGSGECLDRSESAQATAELETGKYDLVLCEDLGRIFRRMHAFLFCESAEDFETRVIAPNDHVDTGRDDWRMSAHFAAMRHEMYNADTAKRIRRTLRNRFQQGGAFQCQIYGYIKPPGAKSDDDVRKDPEAEPVYDQWFKMLEDGATFSEVADWLNENKVPLGPYVRKKKKWDGTLVGQYTRNPILKGLRVRNNRMAKRINKTGRRKSIKAPAEERLERECPHLAFIEPERYDRVIRMLQERNAKYRRKGENGRDTRANVSKKRTRWPGQHIYCGVCRRVYVFGGHGQKEHLMCTGAREHKCWNGITADGPLSAVKITEAVFAAIEKLPGFEPTVIGMLEEEVQRASSTRNDRLQALAADNNRDQRKLDNLVSLASDGPAPRSIVEEIRRLEAAIDHRSRERELIEKEATVAPALPPIEEIKRRALQSLQEHAADSQEFARLMRRLIPRIHVFPYRLCDGGHFVLRAGFQLTLAPLVPEAERLNAIEEALTAEVVVDLFDPPQREAFRERVVAMRKAEKNEDWIAEQLGITKAAVQRAAALSRKMQRLGIADPYLPVASPPDNHPKLRRHKHPRYRFEPLGDNGALRPDEEQN